MTLESQRFTSKNSLSIGRELASEATSGINGPWKVEHICSLADIPSRSVVRQVLLNYYHHHLF